MKKHHSEVGERTTTDRNAAVRAALKDASVKGKLCIVAAMHGMAEGKLREYADGDDSALPEQFVAFLAIDLQV